MCVVAPSQHSPLNPIINPITDTPPADPGQGLSFGHQFLAVGNPYLSQGSSIFNFQSVSAQVLFTATGSSLASPSNSQDSRDRPRNSARCDPYLFSDGAAGRVEA